MTSNWHHVVSDVAVDHNGPTERRSDPLSVDERAAPLFAVIERRAAEKPDKVAVVTVDRALTYRETIRAACGLAGRIRMIQGSETRPVCVLAPQGSLHLISGLACLRLGIPYVPLDPAHSPVRNLQIAARSGATTLVCRDEDRETARAFAPRARIVVGDDADCDPDELDAPYPAADATVSIFFTSGSTGIPKGVARTTGSLTSTIDNRIRAMHHNREDRFGYVGGPSVAGPLQLCMGVLALGGRYSLIAASAPLDDIVAMLTDERVTMLHCGISMLRLISQHSRARQALGHVAGVRTVGDIVEWRDIAALRAVLPPDAFIYCNYAATESSQIAGWFLPRALSGEGRVPLGYPARGSDLWIDREAAGQGDTGVTGEMVVASPRLASGYWNDPETTARAFLPHPLEPARMIYRTGDIVRLSGDGLLHFIGRTDNQVKLHGWRIELEEIEAAARSLDGVAAAGATPRRDEAGKVHSLALHVVAGNGTAIDMAMLAAHLQRCLPRHMWPAELVVARHLPLTGPGKLDRSRLAELDSQVIERQRQHRVMAKDGWKNEISRRIASAIAREARAATCRPQDRFTELGGDSLKALQAALMIEKVFGVAIDPAELLGERPLSEIVANIAAASRRVGYGEDATA